MAAAAGRRDSLIVSYTQYYVLLLFIITITVLSTS